MEQEKKRPQDRQHLKQASSDGRPGCVPSLFLALICVSPLNKSPNFQTFTPLDAGVNSDPCDLLPVSSTLFFLPMAL